MVVIVSFIFWSLAAICNAVMDVTNYHYSISIFKKLNPMWWNGEISWKNKYINGDPSLGFRKLFPNSKGLLGKINYPVQLTDAWHFFKMLMIIFLAVSVVTFANTITSINYSQLIYIIVYGILWNSWFNVFYNKILSSK
jgi:hypothetical protein